MPELRVTVTKKMNKLLDDIVESGMFNTKAEAIRAAIVYFLIDLGWTTKQKAGKLKENC